LHCPGLAVLNSVASRRWTALLRILLTAIGIGAALPFVMGSGSASGDVPQRAGHLYWTHNNWIGSSRLDGSHVDARFITVSGPVGMVVAHSGYLYWADDGAPGAKGTGAIGRARLDGSDVDQHFIVGASEPDGVAVGGGYIYWSNNATGTIGRALLNGTDVDQRFIKTAQPRGPDGVVVGYGHIYWANDYGIGRASLDGKRIDQQLVPVPDGPDGVAGLGLTSHYVYWTNETADTIGRARLNGTRADQRFIRGASDPDALAIDAQHVYWANWGSGSVGRANLDGKDVSERVLTVHAVHGRPRGIAIT
jgi:virginiamycin B lyase